MIFDFGAVSPQITLNGNASLDKGQRGYKIARTGKLGERLIIAKLGDPGGGLKPRSTGYALSKGAERAHHRNAYPGNCCQKGL